MSLRIRDMTMCRVDELEIGDHVRWCHTTQEIVAIERRRLRIRLTYRRVLDGIAVAPETIGKPTSPHVQLLRVSKLVPVQPLERRVA